MVKLFCAVVGEKGSTFSIKIDASESVDDLKDAIKQKQMYDFASTKLRLFLGKQGDGEWLNFSSVDAVTTDANGYPGGFKYMHPSLWINNPNNFGDNFQPSEGDIHVLVVVPKQETSTLILPSVLQKRQTILTLFCAVVGEKGSTFSIKIDASESVDDLKDAIKQKQMYDFASSKLQLFLGKQSDSMWLDSSTADAVTLNGDGYPGGFKYMHPLLWINNPRYFGERFEFKEGDIHVLVVVPENMGKIPSQVEFLAQSLSTWSVDTISSCPLSTKMSFMQKLGLQCKLFPTNEMMEDSIPGYQWSELNEKHPEQRKNYFEYFENHLKDTMKVGQQKKDFLVDVSQMKNLLSCNDKSSLPFELKGTTDLIIVQNIGYHIKDFAGLQFVIEVKKNWLSEKDQWQLLLQIFSVYSKSLTPCAPMGLLTNLNDYWYFLWVTQEKEVAQMLFGSPANGLQVIKEVLGQRNRSTLDAHIPLTISFLEAPTTITCKKLCNVSEGTK